MSLLDQRDPVGWRFYRYGEDDAGDPLFSFYMVLDDETEVCVYDRNDGTGKWHSTALSEAEYSGEQPSDELRDVFADLVEAGVDGDRVAALADHEQYFVQVVHGTLVQKGEASPALLAFLGECVGSEVRL